MHQVILSKRAEKDIKKVDNSYRSRIFAVIANLSKNPYIGKKLEGDYQDFYSVRVWPYRIIYEIYKKEVMIYIIKIGHRQGIYK